MNKLNKFKTLLSLCFALTLFLGFANTSFAKNENSDRKDNGEDWDTSDWMVRFCNRFDRDNNTFSICKKAENKKPQVYIYATKYSIKAGKSTVLYWDAKRADSCSASGGWSGAKDPSSAEKVSPLVTTTYTITCVNGVGSYTDSVEIWVNPGKGTTTPPVATTTPPTVTLNGNPLSIVNGATSTLTWSSTNATACTASNGWSGAKSLSGNQVVSPSATTTYVLACNGAGGTASSTVVIGVTAVVTPPATTTPTAPTLTFNGSPLSIVSGNSANLTWSSTDTTSCTASNGWSGSKATSGNQSVSPSATTTYALSCSGAGGTASSTVTIGVTASSTSPVATTTLDHLVITEVYYDVDSTHGADTTNEWVEIYNGTGSSIDLTGWKVFDSGATFGTIATGTTIANNSYLILTPSTTTAPFWATGTFLSLGHNIGGGLANSGDAVKIVNLASTTVDAMSFGSNTSEFNLPNPGVTDGHTWRRKDVNVDTNAAADWEDLIVPTPGSF